MLKTVDATFCELLLLEAQIPATAILALIRAHLAQPQGDLPRLAVERRLVDGPRARTLLDNANRAVDAAGSLSFSFSKGALIGHWEIHDSRGIGLGGSHFIAKDQDSNQRALLRLVEPGTNADPQRLNRLQDRANAGAPPPHPNILKVDETGEDFGWLFTVTYETDAWNLSSRLSQGPLHESEALPLLRAIADALRVAHGFQVAHGGVSPLSLLMNTEGKIFLSDFGVGSVHMDGPLAGQRPGGRLGVLLYAAPELIAGRADQGLDPRSDIYALGALTYDCLLPANAPQETDRNRPWTHTPAASDGMQTLIARCLDRDPRRRYSSLEALLADVDRLLAGAPVGSLAPAPAQAPFLAPRGPQARPQQPVTVQSLKAADGSTSDEELLARSQAGQDFLAAVAAAAPAPEVPEGYQDELFNGPSDDVSAPAVAPPPPPPPPPLPLPKVALENPASAPARGPKSGRQPKSTKSSTSKRSKTKSARLKKPASTTSAPSKRTSRRAEAARGSVSVTSLLLLIVLLGGIGGGAFGARQHSQLPPAQQAARHAARARYLSLPEVREFRDALERVNEGLRLESRGDALSELRELRWLIEQRAAADLRAQIETIAAEGDGRDARISDARRRYANTCAEPLLELELLLRGPRNKDLLMFRGEELYQVGLPGDAARAFDKALNGASNPVIEGWLERAREADTSMAFIPAGRVKVGEQLVSVPAFYIDKTEVTRARYTAFLNTLSKDEARRKAALPEGWTGDPEAGELPTTGLSFAQARAYAEAVGKALPNAAQFVLAATGPGGATYPWGNASPCLYHACLAPTFQQLVPVASFPAGATPTGAFDLVGNAAEWVDSEGEDKLVFGGSFRTSAEALSLIQGETRSPKESAPDLGFRCITAASLR